MTIGKIRKLERLPRDKQEEYKDALRVFVARAETNGRDDRTLRRARRLLRSIGGATDTE